MILHGRSGVKTHILPLCTSKAQNMTNTCTGSRDQHSERVCLQINSHVYCLTGKHIKMSGDKLVTECHASQMQNVSVLWVGWKQDNPFRQMLAH